jgi:zinc transport system substrate-binding protein
MKYLFIWLAPLLLLLSFGPARAARPLLLASIAPIAYLLEQVGGEDYEVMVLIPAGSSPHTFELTPRQMISLAGCQAFFHLDMPLEQRLAQSLRELNPLMLTVNLNHNLSLLSYPAGEAAEHLHGDEQQSRDEPRPATDPHTWLDPLNAARQAEDIALALGQLNPGRTGYYRANLERLNKRLLVLDQQLAAVLAPFRGQGFLVYHPAFAYLAARYGLIQMAVEAEGKEPGPRRLAAVLQEARRMGVKIIFIQPSSPAEKARALAGELGAQIVALDPLAKDYILNLRAIAEQLQAGWQ